MSRELTKYIRPKEKNPEVEDVMEKMGCSEPVARNMLKMRKFGMGPLGAQPTGSEGQLIWRPASPPRLGSTGSGMAASQKRKLQEHEEKQREQDKDVKDSSFFESVDSRGSKSSSSSRRGTIGIQRLGPVMARDEVIDPLEKKAVPDEKVQQARDELEERRRADEQAAKKATQDKRLAQEKAEQEVRKKTKKKPKKKRRPEVDAAFEQDDSGDGSEDEKGGSDEEGAKPGGSTASSGLMSEAEVLARMGKDRKKGERGSLRAAARVQKELEEWEQVKAHDPEYNRAPKFALCFSAETGRKKKY